MQRNTCVDKRKHANMQTICPREKKERKKESKQASIIRKFNEEKTKSEPNHGTTYVQKIMHHGP